MQDVAARTDGRIKFSPGTLRIHQRMLEDGLIVEVAERPDPDMDDEWRRLPAHHGRPRRGAD